MDGACPAEAVWQRFLERELEELELQGLHAHVRGCEPCHALLASFAREVVALPNAEEEATEEDPGSA